MVTPVYPTPYTLRVRALTRGPVDDFGNATSEWVERDWAVYFIAPGAMDEPRGSSQVGSINRELSLIEYTIGAPESTDAPTEYDEVQVDGAWFKVNGRPKNFNRGPFGFRPGITVELRSENG